MDMGRSPTAVLESATEPFDTGSPAGRMMLQMLGVFAEFEAPPPRILADENLERAKELLRLLVKDIQVHDRRRIIPTYRVLAAVRAIPRKVGGTGLEPVTPSLS